jgi:phospholipase/carboxylesterase
VKALLRQLGIPLVRTRACGLGLLACFAIAGCDSRHVAKRGQSVERSASEAAFAAPDAEGWGEVEGLRYREFLLGGARADERLPMLVLIHGLGDQPDARWFEIVRVQTKLRVIMPRAPAPHGPGYSWFEYRASGNDPAALGRAIGTEADRLARALQVLRVRRPTAGLPLVAGFSQGGMLSFAIGVRHPAGLALALPISGMLPKPIWPDKRDANQPNPPITALHGDGDTVVAYDAAVQFVDHLKALGYAATLQTFAGVGHTITPEVQTVLESVLTHAARAQASAANTH